MRIAVMGDIHGNIYALQAVHAEALSLKADMVVHLGDLGGYAPFVNEVVDFMVEHKIKGIQGNYDYNVATDAEHCGCKYENPEQGALSEESFQWTKKHTTEKSRKYMAELPATMDIDAGEIKVKLFHGAPHKNNIYWYEDRPEKFFLEMATKTDADVLVYGHTHKPYIKRVGTHTFINAGSVGKPKDGDNRACLALIDIDGKNVDCQFVRVAYDIDKTAEAIIQSGIPDVFADKLRSAT